MYAKATIFAPSRCRKARFGRVKMYKSTIFAPLTATRWGFFLGGQPQPEWRHAETYRESIAQPYVAAQYVKRDAVLVYTRVSVDVQIYKRTAVSGYKNGKLSVVKTEKKVVDQEISDRNFESEFDDDKNYSKLQLAIKSIDAKFWLRGYFLAGGDWVVEDHSKPAGSLKNREHVSVQRRYHTHVTVEAEIALENGKSFSKKGNIAQIILHISEQIQNVSEMLTFCGIYSQDVLLNFAGIENLVFFEHKIKHSAFGIEEFFFNAESVNIQSAFLQKLAFQI